MMEASGSGNTSAFSMLSQPSTSAASSTLEDGGLKGQIQSLEEVMGDPAG